jgi:hypothetical protein
LSRVVVLAAQPITVLAAVLAAYCLEAQLFFQVQHILLPLELVDPTLLVETVVLIHLLQPFQLQLEAA